MNAVKRMETVSRAELLTARANNRRWWIGAAPAVGVVDGKGYVRCRRCQSEDVGNSAVWADSTLYDREMCETCGLELHTVAIFDLRDGDDCVLDGVVRAVR